MKTREELNQKIIKLEQGLQQQNKISSALLKRVKTSLKYQFSVNETFDHNSFLVKHIAETKKQLYYSAQTSQRLSYLARHDTLTGLYNRNIFNTELKATVSDAILNNKNHALFFLDLDQFKIINDTAGHLAGDEMIKQISDLLLSTIVKNSILARLGGDEFGYIMKNCTKQKVSLMAEKFLSVVDKHHLSWEDKLFTVSVSIGVVLISNKTKNYISALKNADKACYIAKNTGRNRYYLYDTKQQKAVKKHDTELQWFSKITNALKDNSFRLHAQQIKSTNLQTKSLHYEILLRLKNNETFISPTAFLPAAEHYNLITKIDAWVITQSFDWISKNAKNFNSEVQFSINLSGQSLGDEKILFLISNYFEREYVQGDNICFELTETKAISNFLEANKFMALLKCHGCKFALDDFGSGLSSFSYLKNMEFDFLKVDGSFVRDILIDPINEEMVAAINKIGHTMGLETVAEYVESKELYDKLTSMGFDYLQGYHIGKPVPLSQLLLKDSVNTVVQ